MKEKQEKRKGNTETGMGERLVRLLVYCFHLPCWSFASVCFSWVVSFSCVVCFRLLSWQAQKVKRCRKVPTNAEGENNAKDVKGSKVEARWCWVACFRFLLLGCLLPFASPGSLVGRLLLLGRELGRRDRQRKRERGESEKKNK